MRRDRAVRYGRRRPRAAASRRLPLLLALLAGLSTLGACGSRSEPVAVTAAEDLQADNIMFDVRQWLTKAGVRQALLTADTVFTYPDSSRADLHGVHVLMYDERGEQSGELTSKSGSMDLRTQAMVARGNVVLTVAQGGREIRSEELHYDPDRGQLWSDLETTSVEHGTTMVGSGFTAQIGPNGEFQKVEVRNPRATGEGVKIIF